MSYLFQSRLFDDAGALQVVLADTIPLNVPRYEEWAADTEGRSFVTYAPAKLPITARRITIRGLGSISLAVNPTGAVYVTDGSAKAASDEIFEGVRIRTDGVLYISAVSVAAVPVNSKRNNGFSTDSTGAVNVSGLTLLLNFADLGSGVVDTATSLGTAAATFTRATAGASKLSTGLWKLDVASGSPRYSYNGLDTTVATTGGYLPEGARTNSCLQARDLTNASWTKSNLTTAKTSTGIDGGASSCTRCTASAGNGTALQAVTLASAAKAFGVWIKRITGTGEIDITLDNGSTWTNITANINSATFTLVQATQTLANPTVGIRVVTSADAVDVDVAQLEDGAAFVSSPIPTTVAAVTRNADVLTYANAPVSASVGTCYAEIFKPSGTYTGEVAVSLGTVNGQLLVPTAATNIAAFDGTNSPTKAGLTSLATASRKRICAYDAGGIAVTGDGAAVATSAFDGGMGDGTLTIAVGCIPAGTNQFFGTFSRTAAYNYRAKDANLQNMTT